jgi:hypothetical protein
LVLIWLGKNLLALLDFLPIREPDAEKFFFFRKGIFNRPSDSDAPDDPHLPCWLRRAQNPTEKSQPSEALPSISTAVTGCHQKMCGSLSPAIMRPAIIGDVEFFRRMNRITAAGIVARANNARVTILR